jgi:hypothetical protein
LRDSSDSSIRALLMSWPLNNSLLSFVEHMSLLFTHNWGWNMQCHLETVKRALLFPSGLLHYHHHDFCSRPHNDLSITKKL